MKTNRLYRQELTWVRRLGQWLRVGAWSETLVMVVFAIGIVLGVFFTY